MREHKRFVTVQDTYGAVFTDPSRKTIAFWISVHVYPTIPSILTRGWITNTHSYEKNKIQVSHPHVQGVLYYMFNLPSSSPYQYLLCSQVSPENPGAQLHCHVSSLSTTQLPPFRHGFGRHGLPDAELKSTKKIKFKSERRIS